MAIIYVPRIFGGTLILTVTPQAPPLLGVAILSDGLRGQVTLSDVKIGDAALIDQG